MSWAIIRSEFDHGFYERQLRAIDLEPKGLDFIEHYKVEGWKLGLNPVEWFVGEKYLLANPDVARAGVEPFWHYLAAGRAEGRRLACSDDISPDESDAVIAARAILLNEFDPSYYLNQNEDVKRSGIDPLKHFIESGWMEGRNPNSDFSIKDYLEMYPDVEAAGINPFIHYIQAGRAEGRRIKQDLGFRYSIIKDLVPFNERIENARRWTTEPISSLEKNLVDSFSTLTRSKSEKIFVSVSHDDFTRNLGGVQLCLQREASALSNASFDHIHFFPAKPMPTVEIDNSDVTLGVLVNLDFVGFFRSTSIAAAIKKAGLSGWNSRTFAIHSMLGHNPTALVCLLDALGCKNGYFWVHDFTATCAGYHLMRNDVQFCRAPPIDSIACEVCIYSARRQVHIEAHRLLFEKLSLSLIAPSTFALELWKESTQLSACAQYIHPHCRLIPDPTQTYEERIDMLKGQNSCLRVAFAGLPTSHKGWPVFKDLAYGFKEDERYSFFHLGAVTEPVSYIKHESVAVTPLNPSAMRDALIQFRIDVVVLWSICPETFCFAAHEAVASGAALVTMCDGGNAARFAAEHVNGLVLETEDELIGLFNSGKIIPFVQKADKLKYTLAYSGMTADFVEVGAP